MVHLMPTVHRLQVTDLGWAWCIAVFKNISQVSNAQPGCEALCEIISGKISLLKAATFTHSLKSFFEL